jgi:hypothetical protein
MGIKERNFQPLPKDISLEDLVPEDNFYRRLQERLGVRPAPRSRACTAHAMRSSHPLEVMASIVSSLRTSLVITMMKR